MYVEISPRRSGKTVRLLTAAMKSQRESPYTSFIVCRNYHHKEDLKRELKRRFPLEYDLPEVVTSNFGNYHHVFIDDFDFHPNVENYLIKDSWYYVTTARKKRTIDDDDFFTRLVKEAYKLGCLDTSHQMTEDLYRKMILNYNDIPKDQLDLYYYNKFGNFVTNRNGANIE